MKYPLVIKPQPLAPQTEGPPHVVLIGGRTEEALENWLEWNTEALAFQEATWRN